jgi:ubiquinone/menaquinone biosynthesis C-methylase UbiE
VTAVSSESSEELRGQWERFARDDPMFFITGWERDWTREEFFASGREIVGWFDRWIEPVERGRMIEIGCGLGRTAVAWAERFERVDGVDISPAMVEQARELGPPENVSFELVPGDGSLSFDDDAFDFAFSFAVFQHVRDERLIATYLRSLGRVLRPGASAVLQFDTRPAGVVARAYGAMPDAVLPAARRRGMRRYRRHPKRLRALFDDAGLVVREEQGERSDKHWFLLEATRSGA